jgi:hypothetical protein
MFPLSILACTHSVHKSYKYLLLKTTIDENLSKSHSFDSPKIQDMEFRMSVA